MPHFIVEHSANLAKTHDLQELARVIAKASDETGIFPLAGTRVRLHPSEIYVIADEHPDNAFLSVVMRVGAGRDLETKQRAGKAVFDAICGFFDDIIDSGHFMVSVDIDENNPDVSFKRNSVTKRLS